MNHFWIKNKYKIVGALIGLFLHLGIFFLAGLTAEGGGALIYLFANFPFYFLAESLSLGPKYLWGICIIGGILMYGLLGWFTGAWLQKNGFIRN